MHRVLEEIDGNNTWRDSEFAVFKQNPYGIKQELWRRMCVPMIYAHWEGYVIDSMRILIKYLNGLELQYVDVDMNLAVLSLGDTYNSLSGKQSFAQRVEFTNKFQTATQKAVKAETKIATKSNLNSKQLLSICETFRFNSSRFEGQNKDLDALVNVRNRIAHGENAILPSVDNIEKYITLVKKSMDILLEEIDSYLAEEKYLKKPMVIKEVSTIGPVQ